MNHGVHYVSICWTFAFVSHCILPDRCTAEVNYQMHDHCQSTFRLFIQFFFQYFFIGRDTQTYTVGGHLVSIWAPPRLLYHKWLLIRSWQPIRSRFGQRPRNYTAINFWSGLANPSDLDLVNSHATIPQLTSDPVLTTHQRPRVVELAKCPCHSITCSVYNCVR